VPVYEVGINSDGLPFVVSKFVEGSDLKRKMLLISPRSKTGVWERGN
jgi:hypothetical protein